MGESGDRSGTPGQDDPTRGAFDAARDPWSRPPAEPEADETVKLTKDQPAPAPPSNEPPTYIPPDYMPPSYDQPTYQQPSYEPPSYEQQGYAPPPVQPPYPTPGQAGGYGPSYQQPDYQAADPYQQYGAQSYGQQGGAGQPYGYGYGAQPGYPGGGYGYGAATAGKATAVMVLGIASLVTVWCYGLGVVPAIVGLAMSGSAKREIESSGGRLTGLGMVTAGRVTSWITVGLTVIIAGLLVLGIALSSAAGPDYTGN